MTSQSIEIFWGVIRCFQLPKLLTVGRTDDVEVTAGFDFLTLILTLHQNLQWIQAGTDIKSLHSLSQFSQSHHSTHALPHVRGTEKRQKCRQRLRII